MKKILLLFLNFITLIMEYNIAIMARSKNMLFKKYEQEVIEEFAEQTFILVDGELVEKEEKQNDDNAKEGNEL